MCNADWIPDLLPFDGNWGEVLDAIYERFMADLLRKPVLFRGRRVSVRKHPPTQGKGFGFWHCISDGKYEDDRVPDPDRCKRVGWIRAIIENCDHPEVDHWTEKRGRQMDHILWYNEEFAVVLAERGKHADGGPDYYLLKTSYCTFMEHQKRKKRKKRDAPK
ncbi:MAG: hypothetical protein HN350_06935 [Phycisphaerales bacterium]|jgi:hypothetical protein|nr:hypothetical protein [Phycisphaerales bacterium]